MHLVVPGFLISAQGLHHVVHEFCLAIMVRLLGNFKEKREILWIGKFSDLHQFSNFRCSICLGIKNPD